MEVEKHICKLLLWRDEVVIPGFGILKTMYAPATIHPTQHLFQPPHKSLAFTKEDSGDDGVLVNFISNEEKISTVIASGEIRHFVEHAESHLKKSGSYFMEGIGKFYFDIEKQLQFLADNTHNFLLTSYGLNDFISQPVLRPENIPGYAAQQPKQDKKKRKFIWFRF